MFVDTEGAALRGCMRRASTMRCELKVKNTRGERGVRGDLSVKSSTSAVPRSSGRTLRSALLFGHQGKSDS
eukprot:2366347-Pyramimonas_sp.AAC.1